MKNSLIIAALLGAGSGAAAGVTPFFNFTQKLVHSNNNSETFQQRVAVSTKYYKPGGPILFAQGAENSDPLPIEAYAFDDYARELGAACATIEHRYFGTSSPQSVAQNASASYEEGLNLDNILLDSVTFVEWLKKNLTGAENSKVITTGGSYGGALSAWLQIRYPNVFWGSIAQSPGLTSFGSSTNNTYKYGYTDFASRVYYDTSYEEANKIKAALATLSQCAEAGTCASVLPGLNLCDPQPSGANWTEVLSLAISSYRLILQYNSPLTGSNFYALINSTKNATSPSQMLNSALSLQTFGNISSKCIPLGGSDDAQLGIGEAFSYLTCKVYPVSEMASRSSNYSIFPSLPPNTNQICSLPQYVTPELNQTNGWWVKKLGLEPERIAATKRLLIINGAYDPTTALVPELHHKAQSPGARVINVGQLSHTEDMTSFLVLPRGVNPAADLIRNTKLQIIKEWLNQTDCE